MSLSSRGVNTCVRSPSSVLSSTTGCGCTPITYIYYYTVYRENPMTSMTLAENPVFLGVLGVIDLSLTPVIDLEPDDTPLQNAAYGKFRKF